MDKLNGIIDLLGEENVENIKSRIADLIVRRVESDLDDYSNYILYPPDFSESIEEATESTKNKITKMYKDAMLKINADYIEKMKIYMANEYEADKVLRNKVRALAKSYYWKSNEYGKERKFANELLEILNVTQKEIEKEMGEQND